MSRQGAPTFIYLCITIILTERRHRHLLCGLWFYINTPAKEKNSYLKSTFTDVGVREQNPLMLLHVLLRRGFHYLVPNINQKQMAALAACFVAML